MDHQSMALIKTMITVKRKGISTFIATLLLMVLAVSAGVVIYAYTMGYLGGFGGPQTMGAISIDTWALNPAATTGTTALTAYVRNIGKATFQADTVYLNGAILTQGTDWTLLDDTLTTPSGKNVDPIAETKVGTIRILQTATPRFAGSVTYEIKIIGKDNTQLSFQVKK